MEKKDRKGKKEEERRGERLKPQLFGHPTRCLWLLFFFFFFFFFSLFFSPKSTAYLGYLSIISHDGLYLMRPKLGGWQMMLRGTPSHSHDIKSPFRFERGKRRRFVVLGVCLGTKLKRLCLICLCLGAVACIVTCFSLPPPLSLSLTLPNKVRIAYFGRALNVRQLHRSVRRE